MFMMNKSMIFIKKPVIYIRLGDVARVELSRVAGGLHMRGFDYEVILKSGVSTIFSGADKRDLDIVTAYFKKAGIHVQTINEMNNLDAQLGFSDDEGGSIVTEDGGDEDEEDDDDFVAPDEEKGGDDDWGSDDDGVDHEE
jgi:structure-specific recognition protein 1